MQKMAQSWFTGGSAGPAATASSSLQPSLLADLNSYSAPRSDASSSPPLFDIKAVVRSANDTVSGTFSVVSKGVPGSFQGGFPSGKALMYFGVFLAAGVFFVFLPFPLFLPIMVLVPQ